MEWTYLLFVTWWAQAPEMGDVSKLSSEQVAHMFPLLTERLFAAYASGGAKVDGKKLSQALKNAAIQLWDVVTGWDPLA